MFKLISKKIKYFKHAVAENCTPNSNFGAANHPTFPFHIGSLFASFHSTDAVQLCLHWPGILFRLRNQILETLFKRPRNKMLEPYISIRQHTRCWSHSSTDQDTRCRILSSIGHETRCWNLKFNRPGNCMPYKALAAGYTNDVEAL